jgi:23S rRNA pseudouridine1911/1915/1917 synthase
MTQTTTHTLTVSQGNSQFRLDKFLALAMPDMSRSRLQSLIKEGNVCVNGKSITDASYRVKQDESYTVTIPPAIPTEISAKSIPLEIYYEDEHLLVINKAAGMTVHPGAGNPDDTMVNALLAHCGDNLSGVGGVQRPGIVHRLDKDTSGLLVVAKTDKAHQELSSQIAERSLKRVYLAIVWGTPIPSSGTIHANIGRSIRNRKKMAIMRTGGKTATTHYSTQEIFVNQIASLVECRLETGRTHQIRVHMTHKGHSLLGDQTYGNNKKLPKSIDKETAHYLHHFPRQALHSHQIAFTHPITGEWLEFTSPLPEDMAELLNVLRELA